MGDLIGSYTVFGFLSGFTLFLVWIFYLLQQEQEGSSPLLFLAWLAMNLVFVHFLVHPFTIAMPSTGLPTLLIALAVGLFMVPLYAQAQR